MKVLSKKERNENLIYEIEVYQININLVDLVLKLGYEKTEIIELQNSYKESFTKFLYKKNNNFYRVEVNNKFYFKGIVILYFKRPKTIKENINNIK